MPIQWSDWVIVPRRALEELVTVLRENPAGVALIGNEGVGKTTLAHQAAERLGRGEPVWVVGTAALSSVPFGAFGSLVDIDEVGKPAALIAAAADSLAAHARSAPIIIDNARLLDPLSATLVYHLAQAAARGDGSPLIVTVRSVLRVPQVVSALWEDGLLRRQSGCGWRHNRGMAKHVSETPATQLLKANKVAFTEHPYEYLEHGGAQHSAQVLGHDPFAVVKTLIMQDQDARPLVVLMHGNRKVSTKNLARQIGAKSVEPCAPEVANRHSGYLVGGTSPFGTKKAMPVYVEASVLELPRICINGGRRGYLLGIDPQVCVQLLGAQAVNCALAE